MACGGEGAGSISSLGFLPVRMTISSASQPQTMLQGLEGGVTAAALETPAGAALVQRCVQLFNRLGALTRLDDPDLLPAVGGDGVWGRVGAGAYWSVHGRALSPSTAAPASGAPDGGWFQAHQMKTTSLCTHQACALPLAPVPFLITGRQPALGGHVLPAAGPPAGGRHEPPGQGQHSSVVCCCISDCLPLHASSNARRSCV